jgi:uncharacterized protein (TIGR04551 family)
MMRKTTVIAAVAAGFVVWCSVGSVALAQAPEPGAPAQPDAPPAEPTAPDAPSPGDLPPGDAAPAVEPGAADASPAPSGPMDNTLFPNPALDAQGLRQQGEARPDARREGSSVSLEDIFAEDWWSHARPIFEFHGYFRTRAHLFHNFALGRRDAPGQALYPQPSDNQYQSVAGNMPGNSVGPVLCTNSESDSSTAVGPFRGCQNKTQAGANLRLRLNPQIHISDNLRVNTQVDILDNLVLGSTPEGYELSPDEAGGYAVQPRSGYVPGSYLDNTQTPPTSGVNGLEDSVRVKRAWAEYTTPLGEVRFGRMPNHWGLGMLYNSGDRYDDDAQSTVDRLMVASGIKLLDLVIAGMWDFPSEGASYRAPYAGSEPYDRAQLDDVSQYGLIIMRSKSPELTKLELSRGNLVLNTGFYLNYRHQLLANDQSGNSGANIPDADPVALADNGFARRDATLWTPDLWLQLLYKKLRVEAEVAAVIGSVQSTTTAANNASDFAPGQQAERKLRQYGFAFELQQKLVEDRLRLNFKSGWASGDPDAYDPNAAGNLIPGSGEVQVNDDTISTFRFHPTYRVDQILNRYILQRIQGTYYFNPSLDYDFTSEPNGQRLGGGINVVWTRASEFVQTPGHADDLGLELGGALYFQSKDGALNDDPTQPGGFFAQLQYAVLFPLDGLGYQAATEAQVSVDTSAAQMVRMYLGVLF